MNGDFTLSTQCTIQISDFPLKWAPLINFFDSDVPGFPLSRVHIKKNGNRLFGVPMTWSIVDRNGDGTCTLAIVVVVNRHLDEVGSELRTAFVEQMKERLGFSERLSKSQIKECCQNPDGTTDDRHAKWKTMVDLIFPRLQKYFGPWIRCGQFYSKTYGIFRLVSTWNVPGGKKQEIIMTSNLLKTAGEPVTDDADTPINLHLLPTQDEIRQNELDGFPGFRQVRKAVIEFGDRYLTWKYETGNNNFYLLDPDTPVPLNNDTWTDLVGNLKKENEDVLVQFKEDMNRMYQRAFVLVVYLYNSIKGTRFGQFEVEDYSNIYDDKPRSLYPKVLGMILQQAFGNYNAIPVDTWVDTFFSTLLETPSGEIPTSGSQLGKFERFIWETAQLRKTNQPFFDNILHCIKTGILHSKSMYMRKPNPLACNLCSLSKEGCSTFDGIRESKVAVVDRSNLNQTGGANTIELATPKKKTEQPDKLLHLDINHLEAGALGGIDFIIVKNSGRAVDRKSVV